VTGRSGPVASGVCAGSAAARATARRNACREPGPHDGALIRCLTCRIPSAVTCRRSTMSVARWAGGLVVGGGDPGCSVRSACGGCVQRRRVRPAHPATPHRAGEGERSWSPSARLIRPHTAGVALVSEGRIWPHVATVRAMSRVLACSIVLVDRWPDVGSSVLAPTVSHGARRHVPDRVAPNAGKVADVGGAVAAHAERSLLVATGHGPAALSLRGVRASR
jgi:hypothetical protein